MPSETLIDAGPIVAYLDRAEKVLHPWAKTQFQRQESFVTCEAVLAEACARLAYKGLDQDKVLALVERGSLTLDFDLSTNLVRVRRLLEKYADQPMDLADACLVVMSEERRNPLLLTLDWEDFKVYRRHGREVIPTVPKPSTAV
ncbi:MAG TPA: PIN domain-containing protein [Candidatus Paceibacterota bacterium]|nr:PIN domain-containing protein [Candidatus Paceibacterota bacterium]